MAYYDSLISAWNAGGIPAAAGITGTPIAGGMTTTQKTAAVNSWVVPGPTQPTIIATYRIYNAIVPADFASLTAANQQLVRDIFGMGTVDASPGTNVYTTLASVFAGKTATLNALTALANTFKTTLPWWQSIGLTSPIGDGDTTAAGLV